MTIEQAKELVDGINYLVYNNQIVMFSSLFPRNNVLHRESIIVRYNENKIETVKISDCQTLGEYRGSFTQDVLPPKLSDKDYSCEVISVDEKGYLGIIIYHYKTKKWHKMVNGYMADFYKEIFKWCFKPSYL